MPSPADFLTGAGISGFLLLVLYIAYQAVQAHRYGVDQSRNQNYQELRDLMEAYREEVTRLRGKVDSLRKRVDELEQYMRKNGLDVPPLQEESESAE